MQVVIHLNDEKWKHLEMQEGDEIKYRYSVNKSSLVKIHDIQFPDIYSAHVLVSSKESITHIVPFSMQSRGLEQKVYNVHVLLTFFKMLDMTIKVVFWKAGPSPISKVEPRKDDIVQFRLRLQLNMFCFVLDLDLDRRKMRKIPLSGSAMQALEAFNASNQATSCIYVISLFIVKCVFFFKCIILNVSLFIFSTLCVVLPWLLSSSTENTFNCAKKVIEACIKTRCGIPSEVVQLSKEKPFQQTIEMKCCWKIVQTFQELTEDAKITNLMQEYQKIVYKRQSGRNLRIYVCEPETNVPFISLREDKDAGMCLRFFFKVAFNTLNL
ncbi:hypothetical protein RFI_39239 [Reticulomyxa filosa]|uniref:Uncharacterized protein n=1 Tax=Reticulomyxa filosa TaxID=46433 RepID=X6L9R4_RETFI|nr:hypothetical protein RFI_39239 [Reticulomyxa filosa]|eukprot:ETN98273.1 hypothetical protein RFI_39239 [Reticulomyxa filosa]